MSSTTFRIRFVDGSKFKKASSLSDSSFYFSAFVEGDKKEIYSTDPIPVVKDPIFNQELKVKCSPKSIICVDMFVRTGSTDKNLIDTLKFKVSDYEGQGQVEWSKNVRRDEDSVGKLNLEINVKSAVKKEKEPRKKSRKSKKKFPQKLEAQQSKLVPPEEGEEELPPLEIATKKELVPTYDLNVKIEAASNLLLPRKSDTLDPYVVLQMEGSSNYGITKPCSDTVNPRWNEAIKISGYFAGSDLLHIWVYDHKGRINPARNECVGYARLFICDLLLGRVQNLNAPLLKVLPKKNVPDHNSRPGDAGKLKLRVHVAQLNDPPFIGKKFVYPFLQVWVKIISVDNCTRLLSDCDVNPYIVAKINPALNKQTQRTSTIMKTNAPQWNHVCCFLMDGYYQQSIKLSLFYENKKGDDVKVCKVKVPLENCKIGEVLNETRRMNPCNESDPMECSIDFSLVVLNKGEPPKMLDRKMIKVQPSKSNILPPPVIRPQQQSLPQEDEYSFSLGTYDSYYSTSFEGYTEGSSLSPLSDDERGDHVHKIKVDKDLTSVKRTDASLHAELASINVDSKVLKYIKEGDSIFAQINVISKENSIHGSFTSSIATVQDGVATFSEPFSFDKLKKGYRLEITLCTEKYKIKVGRSYLKLNDIPPNQENVTRSINFMNPHNKQCGMANLLLSFTINYK